MIEKKEIERIAHLARLSLTPAESESFAAKLSSILDYFNQIRQVDTKGVEPMVTPVDIEQYLREDERKEGVPVDEALSGAPDRSGNLFKVPPVV